MGCMPRPRGIPIGRMSICRVMITATVMNMAIVTTAMAIYEAVATRITASREIIS